MKNLIQLLTLLTAGLLSAAPSQAAIISFSLDTASSQVQVGSFFDVDVVVHDLFANAVHDELLAFGLNAFSSNTGLLKLTGSTINPLFSDDTLLVNLDAAGSAFPGITNFAAIAQGFNLATLHFQALAAGNVSIDIASDLLDFNQGLIFLNQGSVAISASSNLNISAVPLPPALLMFISGLAMSFGSFRKRLA